MVLMNVMTVTALGVLISTPIWLFSPRGLNSAPHIYIGTYLALLLAAALLVGPTALVIAGFGAPAGAWFSVDSWSRNSPPSLLVVLGTAVAALFFAGYLATATGATPPAELSRWVYALPTLLVGSAGWIAYATAERRRTVGLDKPST